MSKADDALFWQERFEVVLAALAYSGRGHLIHLQHRARKGMEFPAFECMVDRLWGCIESRPEGISISEGDVGTVLLKLSQAQLFPVDVHIKCDVHAFGRLINRDWWRVPVVRK